MDTAIVQQLHSRLTFLENHLGLQFNGGIGVPVPRVNVRFWFKNGETDITDDVLCVANLRGFLQVANDYLQTSNMHLYVLKKIEVIKTDGSRQVLWDNQRLLVNRDQYIPLCRSVYVYLKKNPYFEHLERNFSYLVGK